MSALVSTRRSLHAVAEFLLAGPQHVEHGTIKLAVRPGGFATVREPVIAVDGINARAGGIEVALDGRTVTDVARDLGLTPHGLEAVYQDGCDWDLAHPLSLDPEAAAEIHEAFGRGEAALATFAPDAERVLWPEHFDLGISRDEVNFGVSPGDDFLAVPYAYVGPWDRDRAAGPFWNAPFGAARPVDEIGDLAAWFAEGTGLLG